MSIKVSEPLSDAIISACINQVDASAHLVTRAELLTAVKALVATITTKILNDEVGNFPFQCCEALIPLGEEFERVEENSVGEVTK